MLLSSGRALLKGTRNHRLPASALPEDKLKASSFLLAGNDLGRHGRHDTGWPLAGQPGGIEPGEPQDLTSSKNADVHEVLEVLPAASL
jgi:hypothetical protein